MLPRQGSQDSTTPLLAPSDSSDVSFYLPTTSSSSPSTNNSSFSPMRSNFRRRLSRETSLPSFEYEDENHPLLLLPQTATTTPLTALEEVDDETTPLTPLLHTTQHNYVTPFSTTTRSSASTSSSTTTTTFRPTTISEPTTSVCWSSSVHHFNNTSQTSEGCGEFENISRPNSSLETTTTNSNSCLKSSESSSAASSVPQIPSRDNSAANLRRASLVKKLSVVGEFIGTAAEVAVAPKKPRNPKLGEILKSTKQIGGGSIDIGPLSFDFGGGDKVDLEEALNQRIKAVTEDLLEQFYQYQNNMTEQNDYKGFQVIKQFISKGWGKIGFWLIVTVLAVLTFKDVVQLVKEYSDDPKQSDMNIVFNESMTMPNVTFCMSRTQAWSHFAINTNESTEEWDEIIDKSLNNMSTHDLFLNQPWDYRMVMEAYDVVATLNSMERETTPQGAARSINVFSHQERLETKRKMVKKWIQALKDREVTFEEFTQKVGSETIRRSMQRFQRTTFDENLVIRTRFRTSWISMMQFCFQPWFDKDNFHSIKDQGNFFTMVLSHNPERLAGKSVECMSVDFHGRPSSLSRFMEGKGRTRDGFNDEICAGMIHEVTVEVRARYVMLENDDAGTACNYLEDGEDNEFDCRSRCRMEMIRKMCNCTALTISYLVSKSDIDKSPLCDYSQCVIDVQRNNFTDEPCSSKCLRDCNQIRYEIDHETKGRSVRGDLTTVYLNWGSFEFLTLEQQRVWSIPTFIAALGGSIGMWLGLSILSLLQGATYIFYLIRESKKRQKAKAGSRYVTNPFANPFHKNSKFGPPPKYEDTQNVQGLNQATTNNANSGSDNNGRTNIQIE